MRWQGQRRALNLNFCPSSNAHQKSTLRHTHKSNLKQNYNFETVCNLLFLKKN